MTNDCPCKGQDIMILSCSGASREGRLSNQAAVELTGEGFGLMFCLAGVPVKEYIIVGQLVIQKDKGRSLSLEDAVPEDVAAVKYAARLALKLPVKIVFNSPTPLSPADQAMSRLLEGKCC